MKKLVSILAIAPVLLLSSCSNNGIKVNPDKAKYVVGVAQFVKHEALDSATKGFKDKLTALMAAENREVEIVEKNALGEMSLCPTIVNDFVAKDYDLIMANATPCVSAAYAATNYIPILGTSVTDYGVACDAEIKDGKTGTNVSGTSDLAPLDTQVEEMLKFVPNAKNVGIIYCSSEANSKFQVDEVSKLLKAKGLNTVARPFTDSNDIQAVCNKAAASDDVIYIPTDNTAAANTAIIDGVFAAAHKPVYAGEKGICKEAGFATLSIDYYALGQITAEMAKDVLLGKQDIREYAIKYDSHPIKLYNKAKCEALGLNVPEGYTAIED